MTAPRRKRTARTWERWANVDADGALSICGSYALALGGKRLRALVGIEPVETIKLLCTEVIAAPRRGKEKRK